MQSRDRSLIYLDEELPGCQRWAQRHGVALVWFPEELEMHVTFKQLDTEELFYIRGQFDDYRELPPAWTFTDASWAAAPQHLLFPKPIQSPYGASIFHTQPVICAPFNRLAYKEHDGPHSDWGGPASWLTAGQPNEAKAHHLADMLSVLHQHFRFTRGRMA